MSSAPSKVIVVFGATGTIGRGVIKLLADEPGVTLRVTTRAPSSLRRTPSFESVTAFEFDWDEPSGLHNLLLGADAVVLIPPSGHPAQPTTGQVAEAAARAGVEHILFVSTLGADFEPGFTFGRWALAGERAVANAPVPHTVVRPNSYMSNFYGMLRPADDGELRLRWGDGTNSFVDPHDVAESAARILLDPREHVAAIYSLTGPQALDGPTLAAILGSASRTPIYYVDTPIESASHALSRAGIPAPMREALLELHAVMASSARSQTTDHVEKLTGHAPRSLAEFVADRSAQLGALQPREANELLAIQLAAGRTEAPTAESLAHDLQGRATD